MANRGQYGLPPIQRKTVGYVPTADPSNTTGVIWAPLRSSTSLVRHGDGVWHWSPFARDAAGGTWPIINRAHYTPYVFHRVTTITAIALNVTSSGGASNVVRMGIYDSHAETLLPTLIRQQGTVAGDSGGVKTLTLDNPVECLGLIWVATAPQGAGSPGGTYMNQMSMGFPFLSDKGSSWALLTISGGHLYSSVSGLFTSDPPITFGNEARTPGIAVRVA